MPQRLECVVCFSSDMPCRGVMCCVTAGVMYTVVRVAPQHFSGSADNTMTKPTACAFARMAAAASKAGIRLTINSAFRTYERQVYFWNCFQTKRCNNGNRAARPGTVLRATPQLLCWRCLSGAFGWMDGLMDGDGFVCRVCVGNSNHGRGQALDINTGPTSTATYRWMAANASKFGFRRTVADEPWHWVRRVCSATL
jgi:D-alanyl-D-alanine dipeptidase